MPNNRSSKLALGTAQFGLDYGILNTKGQINHEQIVLILNEAIKSDINVLDTAIVYGNCESILGKIGVKNFHIITKLPPFPYKGLDIEQWAIGNVQESIKRLNVDKVYGLLLHRSIDFLGKEGLRLYDSLICMKNKGLVNKIGVSIYDPNELDELDNNGIELDIVQAPFNVFDRRLEVSGWLSKLKKSGTEIHARSIFLQGILLASHEVRPAYFSDWADHFRLWDKWLVDSQQTALEACINFVCSYENIDKILVGIESVQQLITISSFFTRTTKIFTPNCLISNDHMLINPSNWEPDE